MKRLALISLFALAVFGCNTNDDSPAADGIDDNNVNAENNVNSTNNTTNNADMGSSEEDMGGEVDMADEADMAEVDMGGEVDMGPFGFFETVEVVSQTGEHPGATSTCVYAECPSGTTLVGGGGDWTDGDFTIDNLRAESPSRFALCGMAPSMGMWRAQAICATPPDAVEYVREEGTMPANTRTCVTAECPLGTYALSGGGYWDMTVTLDSSRRTRENAWQMCGTGTADTNRLNVDVVCGSGPEAQLVQSGGTHPGPGGKTCIYATCPSGHVVVGGGGEWGAVELLTSAQVDDPRTWALCGTASTTGISWNVEAVCVPAP